MAPGRENREVSSLRGGILERLKRGGESRVMVTVWREKAWVGDSFLLGVEQKSEPS